MLDVRTFAATVVVAAAGLAVAPGQALADDRMCRGSLGAVTVDDDVVVPPATTAQGRTGRGRH